MHLHAPDGHPLPIARHLGSSKRRGLPRGAARIAKIENNDEWVLYGSVY